MSDDGERMRVNATLELHDRPTRKFGLDVSVPDDYGVTYQEAFTSQGYESLSGDSGFALGCGDLVEVRGVEGAVSIHGNVHYFARSACKKAIARERARRHWFPVDEEGDEEDQEPVIAGRSFGAGIGGC